MVNMERTLVLVKPDAMQRGLAGVVIGRIERRGLRIVGMKLIQVDLELARRHYAEHEGKGFFQGLVDFITSAPVIAAVFEGPGACAIVRATIGATDPAKAAAGTVRADFGISLGRNLVHASDSPESGEREVALFFRPGELVEWERDTERWIVE
jgi:nucleoside-diphosphate kinase